MTEITIIQPDPTVPIGRIAPWLEEIGATYTTVRLYREPVPAITDCGEGIIILGGAMDALNEEKAPWLPALRTLLDDALTTHIPVIGICLGHQIIANCFGGTVTVAAPGQGQEGAAEVTLTSEGACDPLLGALPTTFEVAESHFDAVDVLPPQATLLATGEPCPVQAFRLGSIVGVQFHPEATPELVDEWSKTNGTDSEAIVAKLRAVDKQVEANGRALIAAFVEQVGANQPKRACSVDAGV